MSGYRVDFTRGESTFCANENELSDLLLHLAEGYVIDNIQVNSYSPYKNFLKAVKNLEIGKEVKK